MQLRSRVSFIISVPASCAESVSNHTSIIISYVHVCAPIHTNTHAHTEFFSNFFLGRLGEACNHIAALLFYLEDAKKKRLKVLPSTKTCTDQPMMWNQPAKKVITPLPLQEIKFVKPCHENSVDKEEGQVMR